MASVRLDRVAKRFDGMRGANDAPAVDGITLEIPDGEFAVLVGPSGCGKTTVLRMIAGLESPTAGRIHIGGVDVTDLPPRDRDIAMVFQNYALYPHLPVRENIGFGLRMRRVDPKEITRRTREVAESLEIGELLDRRPAQLSGDSGSGWRSPARSCASPPSSSSTNRSPTSTPRSARRPAENWCACIAGLERRWSTSPTTRWRR